MNRSSVVPLEEKETGAKSEALSKDLGKLYH